MPRTRTAKAAGVTVKSSMRTLEILEYCDVVRRPVTVSELASQLDYPQSSTSTLVQSLVNHGYLVLGPDGRSVKPSSRVAALGRWVDPAAPRADVRALMDEVATATGHTILLGVPSDLCVRYVDVIPSRHPMRLEIKVGDRLPLVRSGMGLLLLSRMPDAAVLHVAAQTRERIAARGAAGVGATALANIWNDAPDVPDDAELLAEVAAIRRRGYALSLGQVTHGAGILCLPVPTSPENQGLSGLGIGGLSSLIARDERTILEAVKAAARQLGVAIPIGEA
ncbi:helix-turn-helix domain-containing protein (plasmid) [Methylobacterium currus]|uniref:IclR family transcriptional regulator n=1 Tax=Methylobacterium currus TaxID=2051553 RepID=UPI001E529DA6|nr:helix-turn-helix domain-containing protein [Methylobacterium currus]UHC19857.1 helix-turn-helix domain-containing protein [Methylobacterium currus]